MASTAFERRVARLRERVLAQEEVNLTSGDEDPEDINDPDIEESSEEPVVEGVVEAASRPVEASKDLSGMKIKDLRKMASKRKIEGFSAMSREQLIEALK